MPSINLSAESFNSIMKSCKAFTDTKGIRESLAFIHLKCDKRIVTALALDGNKALKLTVGARDGSDECVIALPLLKPVKAKETPFVRIVLDGNRLTVETLTGTQTSPAPRPDVSLFEGIGDKVFAKTEPVKSLYFNPKLVAETLGSIPTDCVRIDYYGEVRPVEVWGRNDNEQYHAVVLPMRCTDKKLTEARDSR